MDSLQFFGAARLVIVAGKGGVGKTTVTAVMAHAAARAGLRVLAVELEGKPALADLLADSGVEVMTITAPEALGEYLDAHGLKRVSKRLATSGIIDVVATAAPGIDDIVVLGKLKQLERLDAHDLIVVDGPAAGHAITFLLSARGLLDTVRGGPIKTQAEDVLEMFNDPDRCQVILVTLPETTPINELIETAYSVEERVGVQLGPVIVNGVDLGEAVPELDSADAFLRDAARFRNHRREAQRDELDRLSTDLALTQIVLPQLPVAGVAVADREPGRMSALDAIVDEASIIVSCGSGGVGKTTAAAAIALHAASIGKRVVVVTIDPARRLADALGLADGLTNEPTRVDAVGELWAMMLDPATTFDGLVRQYAASPERAERILANAFYHNIAGALSGTQEYMAAEKLYQLHRDERFDLVVVDTPPTRNALDFLDAPATLTRFINHRLFRLMMLPARGGLKVLNIAAQPVLRTIGKVVGGDVLADAIAFFQAFEGMETGFRDRADAVSSLLRSPVTRYVLVASARHDTVEEARYFASRLAETQLSVAAVVVNRLQPRFGTATVGEAAQAAERADRSGDVDLAAMWRNLGQLRALADAEEAVIAPLVADTDASAVHRVPLLDDDVHDLGGLRAIAGHLFTADAGSSSRSSADM